MLKLLKPIVLVFVRSKGFKRFVIDLLKALVKQTDNTLDDQAILYIESKLFP